LIEEINISSTNGEAAELIKKWANLGVDIIGRTYKDSLNGTIGFFISPKDDLTSIIEVFIIKDSKMLLSKDS